MVEENTPRRILIVEDDRDFSQSLADILLLHKYQPQVVATLQAAREALAEGLYPVVLCDMRLGQEQGLELLDHINAHQLPCKYIVVTAYAEMATVIAALQKGASDFLRKPLDIPQVIASLQRTFEILDLERSKQAAEAAQQQHERELAASEERFRTLFDTSPDGILLSDLETGKILDVNEVVCRRTGYAREELLGKDSLELNLWNAPERDQLYRALRDEGRVRNMEVHYRHPGSGAEITGLLSAEIVTMQARRYLMTVVRDITELRRAELLSAAIIDHLPGIFFLVDAQGKLKRWNDNYAAVLGYEADELEAQPMFFAIPENERERVSAEVERLYREGRAELETRLLTKDGREIPYLLNGIRFESMGERFLLGFGLDISERVAAEQALRESEAQYRQLYSEFQVLLDGIPDALVLFDPELQIVWVNKGAEDHFQARVGELPGRRCRDIWGLDNTSCEDCLRRTFEQGEVQEKVHHDAEGRVWGMKVFPIRDSEGTVVNAIQISSDLTEKIALREEADRASRLAALGEMAAGVAHEINNPNGMILINLGLVEQALEEGRPILDRYFEEQGDFPWGGIRYSRMRDEIPRLVTEMRDASQRIKRTVEELKGFTRRDPQSEFTAVDLNACIAKALRLAAPDLEGAGAEVITELVDNLPAVRGIPQRLEQILVNLLSNASHALTERDRRIEVSTHLAEQGGRVLVRVRDYGAGILPEHLERLTDPFFTTRREVGGTGLGLSLSARMAKEHGGTLEFSSTPGAGTTVTLTLPVTDKETP